MKYSFVVMFKRKIAEKINNLRNQYPVIQLTGPRQSGKTTLVKDLFEDYEYKNLENPDQRSLAFRDPKSFLKLGSGTRMIIDEIQEAPDLVSYIQVEVDEQKINSQFVITGSQNFKISETVSQSLAGRVAVFELLPLTYAEMHNKIPDISLAKLLLNGFFPAIYSRKISPIDYYRDFTNTYLTRDVRQIKNIGNLSTFQRFLELLAGRIGQVVNMASLASDTGISAKTVEEWLSILEASYLIVRLQPFFENTSKRLIKSPKIYFSDTGLAAYLLGINSENELTRHFSYGALFENFIILEQLKSIYNERRNERQYFWRDNKGIEIDLLIDKGLQKDLVEIKSSRTFDISFLKNIAVVKSTLDERYEVSAYVVYNGDQEQEINGVKLKNWSNFNYD